LFIRTDNMDKEGLINTCSVIFGMRFHWCLPDSGSTID